MTNILNAGGWFNRPLDMVKVRARGIPSLSRIAYKQWSRVLHGLLRHHHMSPCDL